MLIEHLILGSVAAVIFTLLIFEIIRERRATKKIREAKEKYKKENPYVYVYNMGGFSFNTRRATPLTQQQIDNWQNLLGVEVTRADD